MKRQKCHECLLKQRCLYSILFETKDLSPPFVLEPPLTEKTHFAKDEEFEFRLILFGEANKSLPYIVYALKQGENLPVGKGINGKKGGIRLQEVKRDGRLVYSCDKEAIMMNEIYSDLKPPHSDSLISRDKEKINTLMLQLITPLRVKYRNRLNAELPFHVFIRAVLRRISFLFCHYGEGEPALDYSRLVKKAESIKTVESKISWYDWRRYSFRQNKAMLMGGMIGSVTYEGDMSEFIPLIELCEKFHIGKHTSFGLGKIKAEILA